MKMAIIPDRIISFSIRVCYKFVDSKFSARFANSLPFVHSPSEFSGHQSAPISQTNWVNERRKGGGRRTKKMSEERVIEEWKKRRRMEGDMSSLSRLEIIPIDQKKICGSNSRTFEGVSITRLCIDLCCNLEKGICEYYGRRTRALL